MQSLINSNTNKEPPSPNPAYPLANLSDEQTVKDDKAALMKVAVKQELVKGDVIVAEGDLYQRLYIVASGQCIMRKGDRPLVSVQEGEVFGYSFLPSFSLSLSPPFFFPPFFLPPSPLSSFNVILSQTSF